MSELCLIAAVAQNGVIGRDNDLPWRLSADLKHFKSVTLGCPVIMGRKTWESLPFVLPGRRNIVVTRQTTYQAEGVDVVTSLDAALALSHEAPRSFVIGGAALYELALPRAGRLFVTEVQADIAGDTHFPNFDRQDWSEISSSSHPADADNEYAMRFVELERCPA